MELLLTGQKKKIELSDTVFGCEFNEPLIHQVVTAYLAAGRAGTQSQKTRAEVRGGGAKPWNQKGSGRARAGTTRSPIWRKGGVVFAAKPRSYEQKVNKKMYKGAMRSILSELIRLDRLKIIDNFTLDTHKTKDLLKKLNELKLEQDVLIVHESVDKNLYLASRNLHKINVCDAAAINPALLVGTQNVVISTGALKQIEENLK